MEIIEELEPHAARHLRRRRRLLLLHRQPGPGDRDPHAGHQGRHDLRAGGRGHRRRLGPDAEYEECVNKARAVLRAVEMARTASEAASVPCCCSSTTTTRSPTTSSSTSASWAPDVRVVRNDEITVDEIAELAPDAHRDLARARARRTRRASRSTSSRALRGQDPDPRRLPGAPVRSARRSAARSCARRASCTARPRTIHHDGRGSSRGCRTRSRRRATTRCDRARESLPDCARGHGADRGGRDHGRAPQDAAASRACSSTPSRS